MTLREYLSTSEKPCIYISSKQGYAYIGAPYDAENYLNGLDYLFVKQNEEYKIEFDVRLKRLLAKNGSEKLINKARRNYKKYKNKLDTYIPWLDREVLEISKHSIVPPFGEVVLVDGTEGWGVWDIQEFMRGRTWNSRRVLNLSITIPPPESTKFLWKQMKNSIFREYYGLQ